MGTHEELEEREAPLQVARLLVVLEQVVAELVAEDEGELRRALAHQVEQPAVHEDEARKHVRHECLHCVVVDHNKPPLVAQRAQMRLEARTLGLGVAAVLADERLELTLDLLLRGDHKLVAEPRHEQRVRCIRVERRRAAGAHEHLLQYALGLAFWIGECVVNTARVRGETDRADEYDRASAPQRRPKPGMDEHRPDDGDSAETLLPAAARASREQPVAVAAHGPSHRSSQKGGATH